MESILLSIKKLLGIDADCTQFDQDLIMDINSVFMVLAQIGVGPENGFTISDTSAVWSDFIPSKYVEGVKSYVHHKVRLLFDPPTNSTVMESEKQIIAELEWRLNVLCD